jgi:hypothetical protein
MIIYGVKVTPLKSIPLAKEFCPNCKAEGSLVLSVFSKYVYIFLIPTIPVGKTGVTICVRCSQTFEKSEMPNFLRLRYEQEASTTKVPLWTWLGLALIIIFLLSYVKFF